ncbi:MAG: hypothetical protein ACI897_001634, partial [Flavobacteriales bacterium]
MPTLKPTQKNKRACLFHRSSHSNPKKITTFG